MPLSPFVCLQGEAERQRGRRQGHLGPLSSESRKEELEKSRVRLGPGGGRTVEDVRGRAGQGRARYGCGGCRALASGV